MMEDLVKDLLEVLGIIGAIAVLREIIRDYLPRTQNLAPQPGTFSLRYRAYPRPEEAIGETYPAISP